MSRNVVRWLTLGLVNVAGVLALISIVRSARQSMSLVEVLPLFAILALAGAINGVVHYVIQGSGGN